MSEENACPYGSSISGVQAQNMQGSCACHPRHCLGVLRIFLTASPLPPALSLHDGQGAQGLHSGKLATSSLCNSLPVTGEDTCDITDAALAELTGFNGRIPTTIFFREAVVKRLHLFFDGWTI